MNKSQNEKNADIGQRKLLFYFASAFGQKRKVGGGGGVEIALKMKCR